MKRQRLAIGAAVALLFATGLYLCVGLFVIQPMGAAPEGATIVYWRVDLDLPFLS